MPKWLAFSSRASSDAVSLPGSFCCAKIPFCKLPGQSAARGPASCGCCIKSGGMDCQRAPTFLYSVVWISEMNPCFSQASRTSKISWT